MAEPIRISDVSSTNALVAAAANPEIGRILVSSDLFGVPTIELAAGQTLRGANPGIKLHFDTARDGVRLSRDNRVEDLELVADPGRRVIFNDITVADLGRLVIEHVRAVGVVQILAADRVRSGHVEVRGLDILSADARGHDRRPAGYGVEVLPGAFTLWNQQSEPTVTITAHIVGVSAGRAGAPVRGSGVFVSGAGDTGGRLVISLLETGAVYSDGGIAPGTPDRIAGGVFTVHGAFVDQVRTTGPVTTYGANDMVLDNWGAVETWISDDKITSYGPSGIGFVNFGTIGRLQVNATVETFGKGARGFNVYAGTVREAEFERLVTHGDGAVGLQISQPVGRIGVRRGIETFGGRGPSLVKGVVIELAATALSIKPGGSAREIKIAGSLVAHGPAVEPLELHGEIGTFQVSGGFTAAGGGFDAL